MENSFEHLFMPLTSMASGQEWVVVPDVFSFTIQIVNVCFIGDPSSSEQWTLIDAGMPNSASAIIDEAERIYGTNCRPKSILLTHGHFDHVGSIVELVQHWKVPVYAHPLELPYLTGAADYPPGDPTVDGGLVSELSPLFPNQGIDLGHHVQPLPSNGRIPGMVGWRWLHTPGHTEGHISVFRDEDRILIAGDAFVTVKQESLYKVFTQMPEISGPPKYFTTDWKAAWKSIQLLQALQPRIAVTGHGRPMTGEPLSEGLDNLARDFHEIAVPEHGRFLH